jgi:hypothetical protein
MKFALTALAAAALAAGCASRQFDAGTLAPDLQLDQLVQAPADANADWNSLRGNVVILEFFATW